MSARSFTFIRLARRFFDHWLWREKRELSKAEAWLDLLEMATYSDELPVRSEDGVCLNLQRGELVASLRFLSARWRWAKSKVERFLDLLARESMIETRIGTPQNGPTGTGVTVIKLLNYGKFNPSDFALWDTPDPPNRDGPRDEAGTPPGRPLYRERRKEGKEGGRSARLRPATPLPDPEPALELWRLAGGTGAAPSGLGEALDGLGAVTADTAQGEALLRVLAVLARGLAAPKREESEEPLWAMERRLERLDSEIREIEDQGSHTALGIHFSDDQRLRLARLKGLRKTLRERVDRSRFEETP